MRPKLRDKSLTFLLLLILVFVLSQIVLAQNTSSFQIKDSYIEVQKSSYPQNIALVKKENGKEEIAGQVKIVDQYLISDIPENEFLEEYPNLKEGFQGLSMSLETDGPLFNKENFYHPSSLFEKTKFFFGFKTLPEYRITKEVDKSQSIQTTLNLSTLTFDTNYKKTEEGYIKQTLTFKNNTNQDLNLDLNLKHIINAEKVIWNKEEYEITQTPRSFDPEIEASISFNLSGAPYLAIYDFTDTLSFDPQLWVFKKDSQNIVLLQLLVKVPANSSIIIDPWYGFVGDKKYAWGENVGWLNFYPTNGKVYVATDCLKGYAWAENIGWINFGDGTPGAASDCNSGVHYANESASDFGVNNDGSGNLYGYAWGENIGWLNFYPTHSQVEIDSSGNFSGYAWAENVGWMNFGHTQTDYVPQTEWTSNTAPTVSSVSLNGGSDINLTANDVTEVKAQATVTDAEGCTTISTVEAKIYRSGATSGKDCTADKNDCYSVATCTVVTSGNTCTGVEDTSADYECTANMKYYADPTDAGVYSAENWMAWVKATDDGSLTDDEYSPTGTTPDVKTQLAFSLSTDTINYGEMSLGTNTEATNQTVNIINTGNVRMDVQFDGYGAIDGDGKAMVCTTGSIIIGNEKYDISDDTYASLDWALTDTATERDWNVLQRTNDLAKTQGEDQKWSYWGLAIPAEGCGGSCSGYVTFTAVNDAGDD